MSDKKTQPQNGQQNLDSAPEIGGKTVVTQDEFLKLEIQKAVDERLKSMTMNAVFIGCTVTDKRQNKGGPKKDSNGMETGDFWPDKYNVEISFEGGKFPVRVDESTYFSLEIGSRYLAKGAMESKINEHGFSVPSAKITTFERLF